MMCVLVLHDAFEGELRPDEADVLLHVEVVSAALRRLGHAVEAMPVGLDLAPLAARLAGPQRPDLVVNLVESAAGKGRLLALAPSVVEASGVPMAGCPAQSLALTSDKPLAKRWMALAGIDTPRSWTAAELAAAELATGGRLDVACIVKSATEHASIGLDDEGVFPAGTEASRVLARCRAQASRFGGSFFAEAFVPGREFNVGVLDDGRGGPQVLPIAEICFVDWQAGRPQIVGYEAKWDEQSEAYERTQRRWLDGDDAAEAALAQRLADLAARCWRLFGLRGYARVDIRLDDAGRPWVLEVNANPCITPGAGFVAAAERLGLGIDEVVGRVVASALREATAGAADAAGGDASATANAGGAARARAPFEAPRWRLREEPQPEDVEAVRALVEATGYFRPDEVEVAAELVQERLDKGVASDYFFVFADEIDADGRATLRGYSCYGPIACTLGSYDLYWIAVDRSEQGRGLGRWVLRQTEQRVAAAGGRRLYAETSGKAQYASTRAFYLRCGYDCEAEFVDFYEPGDSKVVYGRAVADGLSDARLAAANLGAAFA